MRELLLALAGNWGNSGITKSQIESWVADLHDGGWSEAQVQEACRKCRLDRDRTFAPKGFGEFSKYLPSAKISRGKSSLGWWGRDGDWGGDWARVKGEAAIQERAEIVAIMLFYGEIHIGAACQFRDLSVAHGVPLDLIESESAKLKAKTEAEIKSNRAAKLEKAARG